MNIDIPAIAHLVLKIIALVGLVVYSIFGIVMVRQEHLMANVLEEASEPILKLLVYIHLVAAIGLLLLAVVLL